ncbi:hypothetical protein TBLA_0G02090 [Henningerozyma blattae CBS 6284]|uniref:Coronin n=1 Tax=Henningerozyma blattae (strain ATCC 34711 / CBS 6284 / DSM 70876 / NBRC 10599 / NRRL Y-10934 / UCD 77-7) TaxID=1071380 RepID=I2H6Z9_HENB6|nr:hypothetical protein TBLA_0G02090 [Tetrapisispora blattae CBS 6284]CCH62151.1 hypothetical protein TBLA_0G02090 [Tetrapisispora blattae CBS 6284]
MSGKFVRASKYRHVFGQAVKKELQYENVRVSGNAWDSNIIKTNGKFISVNWNASGGGAFAIIPVEEVGKCPDQVPLFRGHTAQVLDTDFDPFNDHRIVSASDDSKIGVWEIPQDYSFRDYNEETMEDDDPKPKDISPLKFLSGHTRKVGHVLFHPLAQNVLASSSLDYTVKIWDVESGEAKITLKHPDMVTSMSFSYDGQYLATVARDKKLRVWDIREEKIVSEGVAHSGAKNQRVVWLGNSDRLATTGFSRLSDRQIGIWDAFNLDKGDLGGFYNVDQSAGILMPFFDDSNKILYIAGKGDGNIRYYEFQDDQLYELSEFQSTDPQRGFCVAPKRMVNIRENEILKCFKTVVDQRIEPISFFAPRKAEVFQDDIYPDAPSDKPALTANEWFANEKQVNGPLLVSMKSIYENTDPVIVESKKFTKTEKIEKKETNTSKDSTTSSKSSSKNTSNNTSLSASPKKFNDDTPIKSSIVLNNNTNDKNSLKNALKSDSSVNELLQKSSMLDEVNDAEDPSKGSSEWNDEDDIPKDISQVSESAPEKESIPVLKKEVTISPKPEPVSIAKDSIATSKKEEEPINVSSPSTPASTKSLGLKQSVEKLSTLVLHLEDVINKLNEANAEKDVRLKELEDKIDQLIKKN